MSKTIKVILANIPKFFTWVIPTIFVAPLLILPIYEYIKNKTLDISLTNLLNVIYMTLFVSFIAFIWSCLKTIRILTLASDTTNDPYRRTKTIDGKTILQYSEVTIGQYSLKNLKVDILAEINLANEVQPDIPLFFDRVLIASPYCPHCSRNLEHLHASYMADGVLIGYKCRTCKTEIDRNREKLLDDVKAKVRKNYDEFWTEYHNEIQRITKGKPYKYVVAV